MIHIYIILVGDKQIPPVSIGQDFNMRNSIQKRIKPTQGSSVEEYFFGGLWKQANRSTSPASFSKKTTPTS